MVSLQAFVRSIHRTYAPRPRPLADSAEPPYSPEEGRAVTIRKGGHVVALSAEDSRNRINHWSPRLRRSQRYLVTCERTHAPALS